MSKITNIGEELRNEQLSFNIYKNGDKYEVGHSRAISDDKTPLAGKDINDNNIGSSDDIVVRSNNIKFNNYGSDNMYGMNNSENEDD